MIGSNTISENSSDRPLILSKKVFCALGPFEQAAALALEKVGKVQIVETLEAAQVG